MSNRHDYLFVLTETNWHWGLWTKMRSNDTLRQPCPNLDILPFCFLPKDVTIRPYRAPEGPNKMEIPDCWQHRQEMEFLTPRFFPSHFLSLDGAWGPPGPFNSKSQSFIPFRAPCAQWILSPWIHSNQGPPGDGPGLR